MWEECISDGEYTKEAQTLMQQFLWAVIFVADFLWDFYDDELVSNISCITHSVPTTTIQSTASYTDAAGN